MNSTRGKITKCTSLCVLSGCDNHWQNIADISIFYIFVLFGTRSRIKYDNIIGCSLVLQIELQ
jgi:hypothetical protein